MRNKILLSLLLVGMFSLVLSCASTPSGPPVEPESLIGTKWIPIEPSPGIEFSLEFEDERFCLWSFMGQRLLLEYKVSGNTIRLANNISYIVEGDILREVRAFSTRPFLTKVQ